MRNEGIVDILGYTEELAARFLYNISVDVCMGIGSSSQEQKEKEKRLEMAYNASNDQVKTYIKLASFDVDTVLK